MLKSEQIQDQINLKQAGIDAGGASDAQLNVWEMQKEDLKNELKSALAEEANLQQSIQTNGYTLDSITIADVPVSECGLDEDSYNILREKVEAVIVGQATAFNKQIADQQTASQADSKRLNDLNSQLTESSVATLQENFQLKLDNESLSTSRDNAARLLDEANGTIEKQATQIEALKKQIAQGNSVVNVDFNEQIKQQEEAKKASRIKVISMVKNDPSGVSDRLWDIVLASNGEKIIINYLEKGKYTVISAEEAAQAQADIEASNNIPALNPISEEPAAAHTPQEEVPTPASNVDGNGTPAQVVGAETQNTVEPQPLDQQLATLQTAHDALSAATVALTARVTALENGNGQVAA